MRPQKNPSRASMFVEKGCYAYQRGFGTCTRNKIYKELFHVDLIQLCGSGDPEKPLVSRFKPWSGFIYFRMCSITTFRNFSGVVSNSLVA
jgi:hypothetical protein